MSVAFLSLRCNAAEEVWRMAERDAANCTYLFLKTHGSEVSYASINEHFGLLDRSPSLLDIKQFIEAHNVACRIGKNPSVKELFRAAPVIVPLEDDHTGGVEFAILVKHLDLPPEQTVIVLHGGVANIKTMSLDLFLRSWNGFAVFKTPQNHLVNVRSVILSIMALAIAVGLFRWKRHEIQKCAPSQTSMQT